MNNYNISIMVAVWVHLAVVAIYAQLTVVMADNSVLEMFPAFKQVQDKLQQLRILSGDCKRTVKGQEYRGREHVTKSGRTCQRWDKSRFKNEDENYCRNPDDTSKGPWCYTTDPQKKWEYCDVPMCESNSRVSVAFYAYLKESFFRPGRITFKGVETNEGGGYNGDNGIFTVPEGLGGIYVFSWSITFFFGDISSELRVNSRKAVANIMSEYKAKNTAHDTNTVTGVVAIKVNDGDQVYIHAQHRVNLMDVMHKAFNPNGKSPFPHPKQTFSGWKLN